VSSGTILTIIWWVLAPSSPWSGEFWHHPHHDLVSSGNIFTMIWWVLAPSSPWSGEFWHHPRPDLVSSSTILTIIWWVLAPSSPWSGEFWHHPRRDLVCSGTIFTMILCYWAVWKADVVLQFRIKGSPSSCCFQCGQSMKLKKTQPGRRSDLNGVKPTCSSQWKFKVFRWKFKVYVELLSFSLLVYFFYLQAPFLFD